jgi:hypothetical protein
MASEASTKYQPNIIIINGGTNDCLQSYDIPNFTSRYNSLLDYLYNEIPNVTIIVSIVIPGTANGIPQNRDSVNAQIRALVADRSNNNQKIVLADVDDPPGFFTTDYLISDGIHPNDEGHQRLAAIYLRAIEEANDEGFLAIPTDTGMSDEPGVGSGNNTCYKTYGSGESHGPATTQAGSGLDDGIYVHNSINQGVLYSTTENPNLTFSFARLGTPFGNHDLVLGAGITNDNRRAYLVWPNSGSGWTEDIRTPFLDDTCIPRGVHWVDVNGKFIVHTV